MVAYTAIGRQNWINIFLSRLSQSFSIIKNESEENRREKEDEIEERKTMEQKLKIGGIYSSAKRPNVYYIVYLKMRYDHLIVYELILNKETVETNDGINTMLSYGSIYSDNIRLIINGDLEVDGYLGQANDKSMERLKKIIYKVGLQDVKTEMD